MTETVPAGSLYVIATPIGNLEDITLRALRVLKELDCVAAEDTRHTKKLFSHYGIHTRLVSYYREKEKQSAEGLIRLLREGKDVGIVSDAGTPGISDPGSIVVRMAREQDIRVIPVPGVSALTAALCSAGAGDGPILFHGFAPAKKGQRKKLLQSLNHSPFYTVFYESPHRIDQFIGDAFDALGDRRIFIARELTKSYEELIDTSLGRLVEKNAQLTQKGEFVLIIWPDNAEIPEDLDTDELILWYRDNTTLSLKDCCRKLASDLGLPRSEIYRRAIQLWNTTDE